MKKIFFTLIAISISLLTFSQGFIWNDSIDTFGSPSFIENGLEPPWIQYLKQE